MLTHVHDINIQWYHKQSLKWSFTNLIKCLTILHWALIWNKRAQEAAALQWSGKTGKSDWRCRRADSASRPRRLPEPIKLSEATKLATGLWEKVSHESSPVPNHSDGQSQCLRAQRSRLQPHRSAADLQRSRITPGLPVDRARPSRPHETSLTSCLSDLRSSRWYSAGWISPPRRTANG